MKPIEAELLGRLLGELDALFEPAEYVWTRPTQFQGQWQRRDKFLGRPAWPRPGLLPWSNPGEGCTERKRWTRALHGLEAQGLVTTAGAEVGLTPAGLSAARALCGRLQLADCLPGLDAMLSFVGGAHDWADSRNDSGYISEASLAGFEPWPAGTVGKPRLPDYWVEDAMLPLATAGLVGDYFRHLFELPIYRLTAEGRVLAQERRDSGIANIEAWSKLKNWQRQVNKRAGQSEAAGAAWYAAREAALLRNDRALPLDQNRITHGIGTIWPPEKSTVARRSGATKPSRKSGNRKGPKK